MACEIDCLVSGDVFNSLQSLKKYIEMYLGISVLSKTEFKASTMSQVAPAHLNCHILQQQEYFQFLKYQHVEQPTLNFERFP